MVEPNDALELVDLHAEIEKLMPVGVRQSLVHALIDLGHPLECEMPSCLAEARDVFEKTGKDRVSIDHIEERRDGGNDRVDNLRIAHLRCNMASAAVVRYKQGEKTVELPRDCYSQLPEVAQGLVKMHLGYEPAPESRWRFDHATPIAVDSQA